MERTRVGFFEGEYRRYKSLGEGAFNQLDAAQLSDKPWRDRESEFASRSVALAEVRETWDRGWEVLLNELGSLTDPDLRSLSRDPSCRAPA